MAFVLMGILDAELKFVTLYYYCRKKVLKAYLRNREILLYGGNIIMVKPILRTRAKVGYGIIPNICFG